MPQRKGITLEVVQPKEALKVRVDPSRLQQIFNNLLSNAVKFSEKGSQVKIIVKVVNQKIRLVIQDQGEGIPLAFQSRVFERFAQMQGRPSERSTGLGLSITRDLVKAMNGDIGFTSRPGKGSYFYIELFRVN